MLIELKDITEDAERKIATYAAICYDASTDEGAVERRLLKLLNLGHLATLRFASATFLVDGISRACSHQLVRSKHLDFLQESQRYVKVDKPKFISPFTRGTKEHAAWEMSVIDSLVKYKKLLELGARKEDARYVLPNSIATRMYVTGNFQAWKDFLKLRQDKAAQWEVRAVANEIAIQLYDHAPNIFKEEYSVALNGW